MIAFTGQGVLDAEIMVSLEFQARATNVQMYVCERVYRNKTLT